MLSTIIYSFYTPVYSFYAFFQWENRALSVLFVCICSIGRGFYSFSRFFIFSTLSTELSTVKTPKTRDFPYFSMLTVDNFHFFKSYPQRFLWITLLFSPSLSPVKSENKIRTLSQFCNSQDLDSMKIQIFFWSIFVYPQKKSVLPGLAVYVMIVLENPVNSISNHSGGMIP